MGSKPQAYPANKFEAKAGVHDLGAFTSGQQVRTGAEVRFHSKFIFKPMLGAQNDIALVKLEKPIIFTDTIRPICLPADQEDIPVGKLCTVAGWGRISSTDLQATSPVPLQIVAPAYSADTCNAGYPGQYIEDQMICAGSVKGTFGTCQGDSGGPYVCQQSDKSWTVYGAVSFGPGEVCIAKNKPSVYTRISSYIKWINDNAQAMTSL